MIEVSVVCLWVRGHVPYSREYVENLARGVRANLDMDHEIVCLTDQPGEVPRGVRAIEVHPRAAMFAWWSKIHLFNPELPLQGKRVLYSDLDNLIVGALRPTVEYDAHWAAIPHEGDFSGKGGLSVVKEYNSSVMVWDRGAAACLYEDWHPRIARQLWGDQDWYGQRYSGEATLPLDWFPRLSSLGKNPPGNGTVAVLCKKPKPHVAASRMPWVARAWKSR